MPFLCSWDSIYTIWAITCKVERPKLMMPCLGFQDCWVSSWHLEELLGKTEITIRFADPDLGGVALIPVLESMYFAGLQIGLPGEDDRSPSSGVDSGEDRRGDCVAQWCVLIRPFISYGVHACWLVFKPLPDASSFKFNCFQFFQHQMPSGQVVKALPVQRFPSWSRVRASQGPVLFSFYKLQTFSYFLLFSIFHAF